MDLVEVSQDADPSVCKIMDYGKFKYQMLKKQHLVKKKSKGGKLKEIKLRPKTEEHDYAFKLKHIKTSIEEGNKVKISVVFRGREVSYMEKGVDMLNKIVEDTKEEAIIEIQPKVEGRNLYMMLTPKKTSKGV
jgi:translation initiation factor IF-3